MQRWLIEGRQRPGDGSVRKVIEAPSAELAIKFARSQSISVYRCREVEAGGEWGDAPIETVILSDGSLGQLYHGEQPTVEPHGSSAGSPVSYGRGGRSSASHSEYDVVVNIISPALYFIAFVQVVGVLFGAIRLADELQAFWPLLIVIPSLVHALLLVAFGALLTMTRDLAVNSWHIRYAIINRSG